MIRKINLRAFALAAVALFAVSGVALALSGSANTNFSARQNTTQQTNYFRFAVNYNDANISTGVKFGRLPSNAFVDAIKCHVTTAFNATSTNVLIVGTSASNGNIIAAGDLNEASANYQAMATAAGLGVAATSAGEVDLYARYQQTGTVASAGAAVCVITYQPNNDQ